MQLQPSIESQLRAISQPELTVELFHGFRRHQVVTECWRKENGRWELKPIAFTEDWTGEHFAVLVKHLRNTLQTGGAVIGAFGATRLLGFASLENERFGTSARYLQLSSLHVSAEQRGAGLGKTLFRRICREALNRGAEKLYISAHSAKETQAFYRAVGCVEAREINARLAEEEQCDCQLEFELSPPVSLPVQPRHVAATAHPPNLPLANQARRQSPIAPSLRQCIPSSKRHKAYPIDGAHN